MRNDFGLNNATTCEMKHLDNRYALRKQGHTIEQQPKKSSLTKKASKRILALLPMNSINYKKKSAKNRITA